MIEVKDFSKDYVVNKYRKGLKGSIKGLFSNEKEIKHAVKNVSFNVNEGEIVGYIGPNGSGKSTTIKSLVGILVPTAGEVRVNGIIPYKNRKENAKNIGVVFGQRTQLWWDIPVCESFNMIKYIYNVEKNKFQSNLEMFVDVLDMGSFLNMPVRQLSLGQRIRADICMGLLHNPQVLFLDEPTIGLDIVVKNKIRELILEINKIHNTTVMLTTHDVSDIEKLCNRVIVINKGEVAYDGSLDNMKHHYGVNGILEIEMFEENPEIKGLLSKIEGIEDIEIDKNKVVCKYDTISLSPSLILERIMSQYRIKDLKILENDLEEIIRKMYTEKNNLLGV